jgi:hypothetical protein
VFFQWQIRCAIFIHENLNLSYFQEPRMKCPKCNYVSFDYNQVCPKCSKDISAEQDKLHIPAFRPNPPAALGALIGEANESQVGIPMSDSSELDYGSGHDIRLDDSSALDSGEVAFQDSGDLGVGMETEGKAFGGETGEYAQDVVSDFEFESPVDENLSFETVESPVAEDLTLEPAESAVEEAESPVDLDLGAEEEAAPAPDKKGGLLDSSELNLDEISLDEPETPGETEGMAPNEEPDLNLDGLDLEGEEAEPPRSDDSIELNLDDLKVNETGELEVGQEAAPAEGGAEPMGSDEISLEEIPLDEEGPSLEAEQKRQEAGNESEGDDLSIDLEDLDLDLDLDK